MVLYLIITESSWYLPCITSSYKKKKKKKKKSRPDFLKSDLSWSSLKYSISQELLKFLMNSIHNVLPMPDNLKRWGKNVVDMKCHLCGF